jgi:hypothetical protein
MTNTDKLERICTKCGQPIGEQESFAVHAKGFTHARGRCRKGKAK